MKERACMPVSIQRPYVYNNVELPSTINKIEICPIFSTQTTLGVICK